MADKTDILGFGTSGIFQVVAQFVAVIIAIGIMALIVYCCILLIRVLKKKEKQLDNEMATRKKQEDL